jgi:hypothetical protein
VKLLEALGRFVDSIFEPVNALFRANTDAPLSLDDPASMLKRPTILDLPRLDTARTSRSITRRPEELTRAPAEGGKLDDHVRYQSEIERGI